MVGLSESATGSDAVRRSGDSLPAGHRIAERSSFSMKSEKFLLSFNRNSCVFCRSASSSA